tara:strand:+ start:2658 stop:2909 length:252 start_codon:yes stop_codon:yes gene_type:complete
MSDMSHEELLEKLRELGIFKKGQNSAKVKLPRDVKAEEFEYIQKTKQLMTQMEGLLHAQVEADKKLVQDLHMKIKKLQHGNGV